MSKVEYYTVLSSTTTFSFNIIFTSALHFPILIFIAKSSYYISLHLIIISSNFMKMVQCYQESNAWIWNKTTTTVCAKLSVMFIQCRVADTRSIAESMTNSIRYTTQQFLFVAFCYAAILPLEKMITLKTTLIHHSISWLFLCSIIATKYYTNVHFPSFINNITDYDDDVEFWYQKEKCNKAKCTC